MRRDSCSEGSINQSMQCSFISSTKSDFPIDEGFYSSTGTLKKHCDTHCILYPLPRNGANWTGLVKATWRSQRRPLNSRTAHQRDIQRDFLNWASHLANSGEAQLKNHPVSLEKCSDFSRDELPFKSCCTFPSVTGAFHLRNPKRGNDLKLYNWLKNAPPPQGQKIRTFYKAMALLSMGTMFCC